MEKRPNSQSQEHIHTIVPLTNTPSDWKRVFVT
jgi:hypothetical protein